VVFYFFGASIGAVTCQPVGGDLSIQPQEGHTPLKRRMVMTMEMEMKAPSLWNNFGPGRLMPTVHYLMRRQFLLEQLNCLLGGGECFSVGYVLY
jgi:hypothetical protein